MQMDELRVRLNDIMKKQLIESQEQLAAAIEKLHIQEHVVAEYKERVEQLKADLAKEVADGRST